MDYKKIGLKCGIEIHQQLEGRKLFCNCPTIIIDEKQKKPTISVKRKLKAVIGETGAVDSAALHEEARGKEFLYGYYPESCCLVDLDEEPPHPINSDSVKTSYIVAKLLNAMPVDEVQVMRKTVVDGSNTAGFQRTALVAVNGFVETTEGKVKIPTICLEEDAAKIVGRNTDYDEYNLSRLGIPLVEIATAPEIYSPQGVRETAEKLGLILRSTGKCKRGLGTIRQDVNISITGGARVEIKGAQDLKMLSKIVEIEAGRQSELLKLKSEIKHAKISKKHHDLSAIFKNTDAKIIKAAIDKGGKVLGIRLDGFAGFIGRELQPEKRLGTEFSDYAKTKAGVGGIFHSDELPKYGITESDIEKLRKELHCEKEDAFVLVADTKEKAEKAISAVSYRAEFVFTGVPEEVRKANEDGTTSYMRPMPGGARMYPETDVVPLRINFGEVVLPKLIDDKAAEYEEKLELASDLAKAISRSNKDALFESMANRLNNIKPAFIAETLISYEREIKKNNPNANPLLIKEEDFEKIFQALNEESISKKSVIEILSDLASGEKLYIEKYKTISHDELLKEIKIIVEKNKGAPFGALVGEVIKKFSGKVDGKTVSEILKKVAK